MFTLYCKPQARTVVEIDTMTLTIAYTKYFGCSEKNEKSKSNIRIPGN